MDGMDNKPVLNDDPSVTLTIRLIMQGKVSYSLPWRRDFDELVRVSLQFIKPLERICD